MNTDSGIMAKNDDEFVTGFLGNFLAKKYTAPNNLNPQEVLKEFIDLSEKMQVSICSLSSFDLNKTHISLALFYLLGTKQKVCINGIEKN